MRDCLKDWCPDCSVAVASIERLLEEVAASDCLVPWTGTRCRCSDDVGSSGRDRTFGQGLVVVVWHRSFGSLLELAS